MSKKRSVVLRGALWLVVSLCWACAGENSPPPSSDGVRQVLEGHRYVAPALGELDLEHECTFSDDFLPVIRCGEPTDRKRLLELDTDLLARIASEPTEDELRAKALVRLAPGPKVRDDAGRAVTYLEEALQEEMDPQRRARLLADLAGAYLLWAEETQSPIEVVVGLEAALEAEELAPGLADAVFNRRLALVLLGVDHANDVEDEPLLHDLAVHLAEAARGPGEPECMSVIEFGQRMDEWSLDPTEQSLAGIRKEASCWENAQDRFIVDVLAAAGKGPSFAELWGDYRRAEEILLDSSKIEAREWIRRLEERVTSDPMQVAVGYLPGLFAFLEGELYLADQAFRSHVNAAVGRSYFGLAARAERALALVRGLRGKHDDSIVHNRRAFEWALRAGSPELLAAVRDQQIDLLEKSGRESEAWDAATEVLRTAVLRSSSGSRLRALGWAASLAEFRGFERVGLDFRDRTVELSREASAVLEITERVRRSRSLWQLGRIELASKDLRRIRELIKDSGKDLLRSDHLRSEIRGLQALLEARPDSRARLLSQTYKEFQEKGHEVLLPPIALALVRAQMEEGDVEAALVILRDSLKRLESAVGSTQSWYFAAALVQEARPLTEQLLLTLLDLGEDAEAREVLGRYLNLRSGGGAPERDVLPEGVVRWTAFVTDDATLHLIETRGTMEIRQVSVARTRLEALRSLLLKQLEAGVAEERIRSTFERLAGELRVPLEAHLGGATQLIVVTDDALAGIPFALFPVNGNFSGREVLLDRLALSYGSNHREPREFEAPRRMVAVGVSEPDGNLPSLTHAETEAVSVGEIYPDSLVLTGSRASPSVVIEKLSDWIGKGAESRRAESTALHFAGHFQLDVRSPWRSTLVLAAGSGESGHMTLEELLRTDFRPPSLLVLSACNTGRGLPPAGHGLGSLAQAFTAAGVERALVTYWSLNDTVGAQITVRFHELLAQGYAPENALRLAQLEHRDGASWSWGAFALVQ